MVVAAGAEEERLAGSCCCATGGGWLAAAPRVRRSSAGLLCGWVGGARVVWLWLVSCVRELAS